LLEFDFGIFHQAGHGHQCRLVIPLRGGNATTQQHFTRIVQRNDLDLGAAEIKAKTHQTLPA